MINLEAQERGAKAYSTLKSYTKDELIEEIRILEHNLAATEEMHQRRITRAESISKHFPVMWEWEKTIYNADNGSNWRILTQGVPTGKECYEIHNGAACEYCGLKTSCKF